MKKWIPAPLIIAFLASCSGQDEKKNTDARSDVADAGLTSGTGGSGGSGPTGSGGVSGSGGAGPGGSGGSGGSGDARGQGGASVGVDASVDAPVDARSDASVDAGGDAPQFYPPAQSCAGYAINFTGMNSASIPNPIQTNFTFEAWIKTSTPSRAATLVQNGDGLFYAGVSGTGEDYGVAIMNDKFAVGVGGTVAEGMTPATPDVSVQSTSNVVTGTWVHVAATRNATTGELIVYVDGVQEGSLIAANRGMVAAAAQLTIGGNLVSSRYYTGLVDELRIWNVTRTPAEIAASKNLRVTGTEAGLVGYYRFDDPGAATVTDLSSALKHASLSGSPGWEPSAADICPLSTADGGSDGNSNSSDGNSSDGNSSDGNSSDGNSSDGNSGG